VTDLLGSYSIPHRDELRIVMNVTTIANTEMDLVLTLTSACDRDRDELEEHMFQVLEAVENQAADVAMGVVVSCNFADHSIELGFTVVAETQSEAQAKASRVLEAVEKHTTLKFSGANTSVREPEPEPAHALAC
jgi:hypothetical protein